MAVELVNWFEIPVHNMDRARRFYEAVFDCQIVDMDLGGEIYPCFPNREDDGFSGALVQYEFTASGKKGPLVYLAAHPDVKSMLSRVVQSGGKIIKDTQEIAPGFGYFAIFEDTEGNQLAIQGLK